MAFVVGARTQAEAKRLLERVKQVSNEQIPFFTSDPLPAYASALLPVYGTGQQPERQGSRGRYPEPRRVPLPDLLYAQVVKRREGAQRAPRVVEVTQKDVFATPSALEDRLENSATRSRVNTSFVERNHLALRQLNRRLTRKTLAFSKELPWLEKQLWLSLAYYHFCLPHLSLRQALPPPQPTRGNGSLKKWQPVTPAMAAGLTDHLWSTSELLAFRIPASFKDSLATPVSHPSNQGESIT